MATVTPDQIEEVRNYLPADADEKFEWDDDKIAAFLAVFNGSLNKTVRQFWLQRVTDTYEFTDLTESTVTRQLSQVYTNAKAMLDYWDKKVSADEPVTRPISFGSIDRS